MFLNKENIQQHKDRSSFSCLSPTYDAALKECAQPRQYSCVQTILALSNIINVPMEILYPCVNGTQDLAFQKFNFKTSPKDPISDTVIKIMWTSTLPPKPNKQWTPNHLVPVVPLKSTSSLSNNDFRTFFLSSPPKIHYLVHLYCKLWHLINIKSFFWVLWGKSMHPILPKQISLQHKKIHMINVSKCPHYAIYIVN